TTTTTQGNWNGSSINVGGNASIDSDDNLTVKGSDVNVAGTLTIDAQDTQILAGTNTYSEQSETTSTGGSMSVSVGKTNQTPSYNMGVNASRSDSEFQSTDYVNGQLNAGAIVSTSDSLTIKGGNLVADEIDITTNDLTVVSLQNTSSSKNSSVGVNVGTSGGGDDKTEQEPITDDSKDTLDEEKTASVSKGFNIGKGESNRAVV
ncbi:hypothetical protein CBF23_014935, partial [Marinomonas agarivorans]